jgi:hypothetical protein
MWLTLVAPPPTQDGLDKYVCLSPLILLTSPSSYVARLHADNLRLRRKIGKRMAEEGWTPNLPIVLVPGTRRRSRFELAGRHKRCLCSLLLYVRARGDS